jgi:hypothetical protein
MDGLLGALFFAIELGIGAYTTTVYAKKATAKKKHHVLPSTQFRVGNFFTNISLHTFTTSQNSSDFSKKIIL